MNEQTLDDLSPIQKSVLESLWKLGEGTVHQVLEGFPDPKPPYTSVLSAFKKLKSIGWVTHRAEGRQYVYTPRSPDEIYRQTISTVVDRLFGKKSLQLFQHLLDDEQLTAEELAEMRQLIEQRERELGRKRHD